MARRATSRSADPKPGGGSTVLLRRIQAGLPMTVLLKLAAELEVTVAEMAQSAGISARTLVRRRQEGRLSAEESERVHRFARLLALATNLLGSLESARHWLKAPRPALGGQTPLKLSESELGAHEVEQLLGRLEHGVF